ISKVALLRLAGAWPRPVSWNMVCGRDISGSWLMVMMCHCPLARAVCEPLSAPMLAQGIVREQNRNCPEGVGVVCKRRCHVTFFAVVPAFLAFVLHRRVRRGAARAAASR